MASLMTVAPAGVPNYLQTQLGQAPSPLGILPPPAAPSPTMAGFGANPLSQMLPGGAMSAQGMAALQQAQAASPASSAPPGANVGSYLGAAVLGADPVATAAASSYSHAPPPASPIDPGGAAGAYYNNLLDQHRQNITDQYNYALSDLANRGQLSQQAIGQLPGQLSQAYGIGQANVAQGANTLAAAQHAAGLHTFMPAGAQIAPIQSAMSLDLANHQADVPLLQLASQNQLGQQRAGLIQGQLADQNSLLGQQESYASQQALAETARLQAIDPGTGLTYAALSQVRQSPEYQAAMSQLQGNTPVQVGSGQMTLPEIQAAIAHEQSMPHNSVIGGLMHSGDNTHQDAMVTSMLQSALKRAQATNASPLIYSQLANNPILSKVIANDNPVYGTYVGGLTQQPKK